MTMHADGLVDQWKVEDCSRSLEVLRALSAPAFLLADHQNDPILEAFALGYLANLRRQCDKAFSVSRSFITFDW